MLSQERQRRTHSREQKKEAEAVALRFFCPNDGSSRPKKIKLKQVICQQLGTGSTRTDRVFQEKPGSSIWEWEGRHKHKGTAGMVESKQSEQQSGPNSW